MSTVVYEEFEYYEERRPAQPTVPGPEYVRIRLQEEQWRIACNCGWQLSGKEYVWYQTPTDHLKVAQLLHGQPRYVLDAFVREGLLNRDFTLALHRDAQQRLANKPTYSLLKDLFGYA